MKSFSGFEGARFAVRERLSSSTASRAVVFRTFDGSAPPNDRASADVCLMEMERNFLGPLVAAHQSPKSVSEQNPNCCYRIATEQAGMGRDLRISAGTSAQIFT
jgi:hypothetical protein